MGTLFLWLRKSSNGRRMGESQLKSHQLVAQIMCMDQSAKQHVVWLKLRGTVVNVMVLETNSRLCEIANILFTTETWLSLIISWDGEMSNSSLIGINLFKCLYVPCSVANNYFLAIVVFLSDSVYLSAIVFFFILSFLDQFPLRFCSYQNSTTRAESHEPRSHSVHLFKWAFPNQMVKRPLGM